METTYRQPPDLVGKIADEELGKVDLDDERSAAGRRRNESARR
jgi:hypothetical protein